LITKNLGDNLLAKKIIK